MAPSVRSIARALLAEMSAPVQARGDLTGGDVHAHAARGVAGAGSPLPHLDRIQASFGHHDVSGVRAHTGGAAAEASAAIGARAYATGDDVAFAGSPDLHTAAHEAAHVVQQRGGVRLAGGVGRAGDSYEQHADAVADLVVRGDSAQALLDPFSHRGASGGPAVQRNQDDDIAHDVAHPRRPAPRGEERGEEHETEPMTSGVEEGTEFLDTHDIETEEWGTFRIKGALVGVITNAAPEPAQRPGAVSTSGAETELTVGHGHAGHHNTGAVNATGFLRDWLAPDCRAFADSFRLTQDHEGTHLVAGLRTGALHIGPFQFSLDFDLLRGEAGRHLRIQPPSVTLHAVVEAGSIWDQLPAAFREHFRSNASARHSHLALEVEWTPPWARILERLGLRAAEGAAEDAAATATTATETATALGEGGEAAAIGAETALAAPILAAVAGGLAAAGCAYVLADAARQADDIVRYGNLATIHLYNYCLAYTAAFGDASVALSGAAGQAGTHAARGDVARIAREHHVTEAQVRAVVLHRHMGEEVYQRAFERAFPTYLAQARHQAAGLRGDAPANLIDGQLDRARWGTQWFLQRWPNPTNH
ncbi:MAG TPA: DUF4157 domain-containing protein [Kofleriaceae bacterium]|nr:DUF4157 domain-containing protein [Kofleriaceae bacterium]